MNANVSLADDLAFAEQPAPAAPHPLTALARVMRGRWLLTATAAAVTGGSLAVAGFMTGHRLYESQAIMRLYPQEANILYRTGDDSVLKTFDSFAKAETSTVASQPVMARALELLPGSFAELTEGMTISDLTGSVEIKRSDSLIVLTTRSRDPGFATAKLDAVVTAYQDLQSESESQRSAVRLAELQGREADLLARREEIRTQTLDVGGEFGIDALTKAHVEKVAQIEALANRKAEVEATLATLKAKSGTSSADMSDDEIMRATLLDRALADLNFDRAKREAELATLLTRYTPESRAVRDKRDEIAVIDRAMSERREQIKVLGQTGALTDTSNATPESSIAEIEALLQKVAGQLDLARQEARDLNAKRAKLAALEQDANENRKLLDETRAALEVIRLEAGRELPGYSVLMSPPSQPTKPVEDSRKTNAAMGLGFGAFLAAFGIFLAGSLSRRVRHSDGLWRWAAKVPLILVSRQATPSSDEADRLRNAVKLQSLRAPRRTAGAQVLALSALDRADANGAAVALAQSFARSGVKTLLIHANFQNPANADQSPGWREALAGGHVTPQSSNKNLAILPLGTDAQSSCGSVGTQQLRDTLQRLGDGQDLVLVSCGNINEAISTELILAESDFALAVLSPADRKANVDARIQHFNNLPRQGGGAVFTLALSNDPGLAA